MMKPRMLPFLVFCLALEGPAFSQTNPPAQVADDAGMNAGGAASTNASRLLYPVTYDDCLRGGRPVVTRKDIYRDSWIDLNKNGRKDIYEDPAQPVEQRIGNLVSQMSMEEKTMQMATLYGYSRVAKDHLPTESWFTNIWKDGLANIDEHLNGYSYWHKKLPGSEFLRPLSKHTWALNEVQRFFIEDTRLGVPVEFTDEGIRGLENTLATCFPAQLGVGQTWNRALVRQIGEITGREAYVLGYHNVYAPILDILRDPRWGRCEETYGEDPFHASELAIQMVQGVQSQGTASSLKHFAVYSNGKGARDGPARTDARVAPREMEMIHLWPYERVIRAAQPHGIMSSYNDYDGIPVTASSYFLIDVLRKRMGFRGYVVSDSEAVEFLHKKHHVAGTYKEAVRQSVMAGLNIRTTFSPPDIFVKPLRELVKEGAIPLSVIDARVADVLRVKFWEGLFDRPYRALTNADPVVMNPRHMQVALQASRECLVLLKNEKDLLPLEEAKIKTIALCGPNADNRAFPLGRYGPGDVPVATVRDALESRFRNKATVLYTKGCDHFDANWPDTEIMREPPTTVEQAEIDQAVAQARQADVAVVVIGDMPRGLPGINATVGEAASRTSIDLTGRQDDLIKAVAAAGKPTIVVHISGRPNSINWANRLCPAILQAFFPGSEGGTAIVEALFGDYNPGGKLTATFPKTAGQVEMNFPTKPAANAEPGSRGRANVNGLLWPFGHGLSYTQFKYSDLTVEPQRPKPDGNITVSFKLTNTGGRPGDEVPQLYVNDAVSSVTTWEKRLCGFDRIHLKPGESRTVTFTIEPDLIALWNAEMKYVVEPGEFKVMVGSSSADIRLNGKFEVVER